MPDDSPVVIYVYCTFGYVGFAHVTIRYFTVCCHTHIWLRIPHLILIPLPFTVIPVILAHYCLRFPLLTHYVGYSRVYGCGYPTLLPLIYAVADLRYVWWLVTVAVRLQLPDPLLHSTFTLVVGCYGIAFILPHLRFTSS